MEVLHPWGFNNQLGICVVRCSKRAKTTWGKLLGRARRDFRDWQYCSIVLGCNQIASFQAHPAIPLETKSHSAIFIILRVACVPVPQQGADLRIWMAETKSED
eukprot:766991-Hanusia_phi.AAC.10